VVASARSLWTGALLLGLASCGGGARGPALPRAPAAELDSEARAWVEETLTGLSDRELAGQLVIQWIPGGYVAPSSPDFAALERWVVEDGIGGVLPSIGTPHAYVAKLNALQERARIPLLVAADFENGGPGMRINGSYALPSMLPQGGGTVFPPTMAFGAIGDERFAFEYGRITAREARASGVHMLFAPVLDVSSNPDNPVIATRSFGADPATVAALGAAFIRGARVGGAYTTGKHFPGHGDTSVDSHLGLPVVGADRDRLDRVELVPFLRAIEEGVDAVMTAHVQVPGVLGIGAPPATFAPEFLTGLLREEMGFDGVLFTDALSMRAITDMYGDGEAAVRAVEAGADVILYPQDVRSAVDAVVGALESGRLLRDRVEQSVRRLLELKARLGLHRERFVSLDQVSEVVGSGAHLALADTAAARSITLVRDEQRLVPLDALAPGTTAHLIYAPSSWLWAGRAFSPGLLARVPDVAEMRLDERSDSSAFAAAAERISGAARLIVSAYVSPSAGSGPEALPERLRDLVAASEGSRPTVLISFGNPYLLSALPGMGSYMIAWGDREVSQRAALTALFGEEAISGRLPIPLPPFHELGNGLERVKVTDRLVETSVDQDLAAAGFVADGGGAAGRRQALAEPVEVGMSAAALAQVDSIILAAVADSAASGVALAIGSEAGSSRSRDTESSPGAAGGPSRRHRSSTSPRSRRSWARPPRRCCWSRRAVSTSMRRVVRYLPWWSRGDPRKAGVTVRQLLLHRAGPAGLPAVVLRHPGHRGVQGRSRRRAARVRARREHDLLGHRGDDARLDHRGDRRPTARRLPLRAGFRAARHARHRLHASQRPPPQDRGDGAGHALAPRARLGTRPRRERRRDGRSGRPRRALQHRRRPLGVRAHAAERGVAPACLPPGDGGEPCPVLRAEPLRLFDPDVVAEFTSRFDGTSSRALGWDTPSGASSAGDHLSARAFGHTGFTGTSLWIDPELDLWVVLLTNRVHPSRANQKHVALRRAVHDAVALAIQ
jgi:beta-N-acetylhexosaminidase